MKTFVNHMFTTHLKEEHVFLLELCEKECEIFFSIYKLRHKLCLCGSTINCR